jgi:hypothetical protein
MQADFERAAASTAATDDPAILERLRVLTMRLSIMDPVAASAQIAAMPDGAGRDTALRQNAKTWAGNNTTDALAWAESLPDKDRPAALAGIMEDWAENEPAEASEFIASLPVDSAQRDAPVSAFAKSLARIDPQASLQWAATVQNPALRNAAVTEAVNALFATDAGTAREILLTVPGLTPDEREALSNPPARK